MQKYVKHYTANMICLCKTLWTNQVVAQAYSYLMGTALEDLHKPPKAYLSLSVWSIN